MRFQGPFGTYVTPTPSDIHAILSGQPSEPYIAQFDNTLHIDPVTFDSGQPGMVVAGGTPNKAINLQKLLISWGQVETAGMIQIETPDITIVTLYQTMPAGFENIRFDDTLLLSDFGLRAGNNSVGGEYSIIAYYTIEVQ